MRPGKNSCRNWKFLQPTDVGTTAIVRPGTEGKEVVMGGASTDGSGQGSPRLAALEERFAALGEQLDDSPVTEALSVLHAIMQEVMSQAPAPGSSGRQEPG